MENLKIYEAVRSVPDNAKRPIASGRLKGKTDINPMWRLKVLTEQFGPCGIGWKYKIISERLEASPNGEVAAFVAIDLYIKHDGEWSDAIPGTGGSMFVANERSGQHTSDECFKMALTDAISVACKALGFGADVYWEADRTKYTGDGCKPQERQQSTFKCEVCGCTITGVKKGEKLYSPADIAANTKATHGVQMCWACAAKKSHE